MDAQLCNPSFQDPWLWFHMDLWLLTSVLVHLLLNCGVFGLSNLCQPCSARPFGSINFFDTFLFNHPNLFWESWELPSETPPPCEWGTLRLVSQAFSLPKHSQNGVMFSACPRMVQGNHCSWFLSEFKWHMLLCPWSWKLCGGSLVPHFLPDAPYVASVSHYYASDGNQN